MIDYTELWNSFNSHFVSSSGFPLKAALCRRMWPDRIKDILRTADLLLDNTFLFQDPWDMEQTSEPVHFEEIDWKYCFRGDEEFVYQMNRHHYWVTLGQAYHLTGNEQYAQCFVKQFLDWTDKEPLCDSAYKLTWRTLEAGLRVVNWCQAMALFAKSPSITSDVIERFYKSLTDHGVRLMDNPRSAFSLKSNWGIMEYTGLYLLGFVLNNPDYSDKAKITLKQCLKIQILDDGMHWEASPMYHNQVLIMLLEALRISHIYKDGLFDEEERSVIKKMAWVNVSLKNPGNCQPMTGDSDNTDVRDLITRSALQFRDGNLKFAGYSTLDFDSIWLYDWKAAFIYQSIKPKPIPAGIFQLNSSGQLAIRNGWSRDSFWLYFTNGPMGGGHGHSHKLHISLWMDGDEILVDPGRYTYTNSDLRWELKNAVSHNVPMVDRDEYAAAVGSWNFSALPVSTPNQVTQKGPYTLIEGCHTGYYSKGITINRRILVINQDIVVICDRFIGPATTSVTQRFHFGEHISLTPQNHAIHGHGDHCHFQLHSFADGNSVSPSLETGPFSAHYNHLTTVPVLDLTVSGASTLTSILVRSNKQSVGISPVPVRNIVSLKNISPAQGEGYTIQIGNKNYGLILMHQDCGNGTELLGIADKYGLGRTMICDLTQETNHMSVLQW